MPVQVLVGVVAVSCGDNYTAAIKTDGTLWMWGFNSYGQLGNGGSGNATNSDGYPIQTMPVQVLDDVAAVSCGYSHTAALKTDGTLWMWGFNNHGQLGNGGGGNAADGDGYPIQTTPIPVLDDVAAVSCGYSHTAALKMDSTLWTWGMNTCGELGNGTTTDSSTPVQVMEDVALPTMSGL